MNFDDDDADFPESFSSISFKFKTIRIVDNVVTAFVNKVRSEVYIDEDADDQDVTIALEKIHFWFDHIVSNGIMFDRENPFALNVMFDENGAPRSGNIPIVLPMDPTDDHLAAIMHSKLNALGGGVVNFGTIEIHSDTRENLIVTFTGYGEVALPTMEEWIGERAFHEVPWWCRGDGSTLDAIPQDDSDLENPPVTGVDMTFIEERFRRSGNDAAIIIRPEFKPEIISGGKDDKPKD